MKPTITIDKYAIRFEDGEGGNNYFFVDLFIGKEDWHRKVMQAIQRAYEICVKENIEPECEEGEADR